ncbi:MAG TPA: radical SAM protein [Nitrospirota bacterium]|jgi:nitrogen fixation protein NifB
MDNCCGTDTTNRLDKLKYHPCFSREAHHKFGRVHMPIAPACNIQCRYCVRKYDCANESRPGVTSRVLSPLEAIDRLRAVAGRDQRITVIGVAGPGDPLANPQTFEFLRMARDEFPELHLCLSTNGLMLPDSLDELVEVGLETLTVTINTIDPEVAGNIYSWVNYNGTTYRDTEATELLLKNQWEGLRDAVRAGMAVKVNTILIPGVNDREIPRVAEAAGALGATIMNIMALIPQAEFSHLVRPGIHELSRLRLECMPFLPMMTHCKQCRADATGLMGEDKCMETETAMARISEDYLDMVAT